MRLTADDVARCAQGTVIGPPAGASGLAFDSRTLGAGEAFVALTGERDGHDFVESARLAGAPFAVVARGRAVGGITCVEVDDPLAALSCVGRLCRSRLGAISVVAVTGSAGKTSTKDFVVAVLGARWSRVHGAPGSYNNDVGVPVTLASAPEGTEAVVVEMGMRGPGEIARLCLVAAPTVGIVTVVADAHSARLGGIDAVARAKAELVGALPPHGLAVLNGDDERVLSMAPFAACRVVTFGASPHCDVRFGTVSVDADGCHTVEFTVGSETATVRLAMPGAHMASNAAAALAAGTGVGVALPGAAAALAHVVPAHGRMEWRQPRSGVRILDDTYNANSASVLAALRTLASLGAPRCLAVLGEIAEVDDPGAAHAEIAREAGVLGIGLVAVETDLYGVPGVSVEEAAGRVLAQGEGTVVVVKGSRASRMERVIAAVEGRAG